MADLKFKDVLVVLRSSTVSGMAECLLGALLEHPEIDRDRLEGVWRIMQKGSGENVAKYTAKFQDYLLGMMPELPKLPPMPDANNVATVDEFNDYYQDRIRLEDEGIRDYFDKILLDEEHGVGHLLFDVKLPAVAESTEKPGTRVFLDMATAPWKKIVLRSFEDARKWKGDIDAAFQFNSGAVYYTMNAATFASTEVRNTETSKPEQILARLDKDTLCNINLQGLYMHETMLRVSAFIQPRFEGLFKTFFRK